MKTFDEPLNLQATTAVSSEKLNEGRLFKEEDDDGRQIIDVATTGNSTKIFYDDGTTETTVHLLGPDSNTKPDLGGRQATGGVTTGNSTKIFYDDGTTETTVHPLGPDSNAKPDLGGRQATGGVTTGNSTKIFYDDGTTETTVHPLGPDSNAKPDLGGRQATGGVTTGNSTKIFYDDGTTETTVHPLGPDTGPTEPVSFDAPAPTPWTATVNPDGTIEAVHGNPNNLPLEGGVSFDAPAPTPWTATVNPDGTIEAVHGNPNNLPLEGGVSFDAPAPTPWTATVNPDGTIEAVHGNPNTLPYGDDGINLNEGPNARIPYGDDGVEFLSEDFPVDFSPDIFVDFPVAELAYTSVSNPVELTWESDCGLPELLAEQTILDEAIATFVADTTFEAPTNELPVNENQSVAVATDGSASLTDAMDFMSIAAIGIENV